MHYAQRLLDHWHRSLDGSHDESSLWAASFLFFGQPLELHDVHEQFPRFLRPLVLLDCTRCPPHRAQHGVRTCAMGRSRVELSIGAERILRLPWIMRRRPKTEPWLP